jgi:hypothetical protein
MAEASFEFLDEGYRVRLSIRSTEGDREWNPVDYTGDGLGYVYPALRHWSADSRYFHYLNKPVPDGCGDFYPIEAEWTVIDVEDGSLSSLSLPEGRGHTASPDGLTLVYQGLDPPFALRFRNTVDNSEVVLPLPPSPAEEQVVQAGGAVWSPDGSSLAISLAYGDACGDGPLSFAVVRLDDPSKPRLSTLIAQSPKLLHLQQWDPSGRILVTDWDSSSWWIDSTTGEIVSAPLQEG